MIPFSNIIFYTLIFLSVYVQVFFFVTFLENRKNIVVRKGSIKLRRYPAVTIAVPCWNEETTVYKTVRSLLALNYPKDKLKIFLVDDGSTDSTLQVIKRFEKYSNIQVFHKENGGKHSVLNFALTQMDTEFFGCLDADSFADPEALVRIMSYFENDSEAMAVAPSVTVSDPKTMVQGAQQAEYHMGVYTKKMLGFLGAINVTPGPLTVFRKKVFDDLGPYRHGHNTEDMEIAYRMQKHGYKIEHCNDAFVYTNSPRTVKTLYKQRLRWIYGFINNTIDYRSLILKKKYGNFALFTLPTGVISILAISYLFTRIVYSVYDFVYLKMLQYQTVGVHFAMPGKPTFDLFFLNTQSSMFLVFVIYSIAVFAIMFGRRMVEGKWVVSINLIYFFVVFRLVAPFWLLKAMYNTVISRKPEWR